MKNITSLVVTLLIVLASYATGWYSAANGRVPLWFPHKWEAGHNGVYCYWKGHVPKTVTRPEAYLNVSKCLREHHV